MGAVDEVRADGLIVCGCDAGGSLLLEMAEWLWLTGFGQELR
jgi:hypothetical protein